MRLRSSSDPELNSNNVHGSGVVHGGKKNRGRTLVVTGAVVPTFTVTDSVPLPLICTDELDKVQVVAGVTVGVTAQLKFTVPENDPDPPRANEKVAVCPALMTWEAGDPDAALIVKSGAACTINDTGVLFTIDPEVP